MPACSLAGEGTHPCEGARLAIVVECGVPLPDDLHQAQACSHCLGAKKCERLHWAFR